MDQQQAEAGPKDVHTSQNQSRYSYLMSHILALEMENKYLSDLLNSLRKNTSNTTDMHIEQQAEGTTLDANIKETSKGSVSYNSVEEMECYEPSTEQSSRENKRLKTEHYGSHGTDANEMETDQ